MNRLRSLALALSAAAMFHHGTALASPPADVTVAAFVGQLHRDVVAGNVKAARRALEHLRVLGIREVSIGGRRHAVEIILGWIDDRAGARAVLAELLREIAHGADACFLAGHQVIVCVLAPPEHFSTGSHG